MSLKEEYADRASTICETEEARLLVFANAVSAKSKNDQGTAVETCRDDSSLLFPLRAGVATLLNIYSSENDNFHFERKLRAQGIHLIAGSDEVGRGPLAGPVVAACVVLPQKCNSSLFQDSKKLTHDQRIRLFGLLREIGASCGLGIVSHQQIDRINILQASLLAMKLAVYHLSRFAGNPGFILVDGKFEIPLHISQLPLVKGETKSASIAAASIVAKVTRDAIMDTLHTRFPHYGFNKNKGYPTREHRQSIARFGPCPFHRMTFKGVREFVL